MLNKDCRLFRWFHKQTVLKKIKNDIVCVSVLILDARQKRAEELRRLTDKSASMSEEQLSELRAEIKVLTEYTHTHTHTDTRTQLVKCKSQAEKNK